MEYVWLEDLFKSFPTRILVPTSNTWLRKSATILPRTSPAKFGSQIFKIICLDEPPDTQVFSVFSPKLQKAVRSLADIQVFRVVFTIATDSTRRSPAELVLRSSLWRLDGSNYELPGEFGGHKRLLLFRVLM